MAFNWFKNQDEDSTLQKILKGAYAAAMLGNAVMDPAGQTQYVLPALESQRQNAENASLNRRKLDIVERGQQLEEEKWEYAKSPAAQQTKMTDYDKAQQRKQYVLKAMTTDPNFNTAWENNDIKSLQRIALDKGVAPEEFKSWEEAIKLSNNTLRDEDGDYHTFTRDQNNRIVGVETHPFGKLATMEKQVAYLRGFQKQIDIEKMGGSPSVVNNALRKERDLAAIATGLLGDQAARAAGYTGRSTEEVYKDMTKDYSDGLKMLNDMDTTYYQAAATDMKESGGANAGNLLSEYTTKRQRYLELHNAIFQQKFPGQGDSLLWQMQNGPRLGTMGPEDAVDPSKDPNGAAYKQKVNSAFAGAGTAPPQSSVPSEQAGVTKQPPKTLIDAMQKQGHDPANIVWKDGHWVYHDTRPGAPVPYYSIKGY